MQFQVGNREQIIERLAQGKDDFYVFSHPPEDIAIEKFEFLTNPLIAIAQAGHPLAGKKQISLAAFCELPFLMREQGSGTRYAIEQLLAKHKKKLNVKMTIESNEAIKHAVMAGLGVSILSAHSLSFGGRAGLCELPVKELPINTHWYFVWLKAKRLSVVAETFLTYVQNEGQKSLLAELAADGFFK